MLMLPTCCRQRVAGNQFSWSTGSRAWRLYSCCARSGQPHNMACFTLRISCSDTPRRPLGGLGALRTSQVPSLPRLIYLCDCLRSMRLCVIEQMLETLEYCLFVPLQLETNMRRPLPLLQVYHYTAWSVQNNSNHASTNRPSIPSPHMALSQVHACGRTQSTLQRAVDFQPAAHSPATFVRPLIRLKRQRHRCISQVS